MSFLDEIQKSWEKGKKGTEEVQLEKGIKAIFKVAENAKEEVEKTFKEQNIGEK